MYVEGGVVYRNTKDYIQRNITDLSGGKQAATYINYGKVETKGFNLSIRYNFANWVSVGGNFTQMDVRDKMKTSITSSAENLATVFGRPAWDVSMYVNVDAAALIGADTLKDGQVIFREGPVCACARLGGFGVLDEVNMAKNEALAVLHATLDFRRVIDVPGYQRIQLDDAARFIGTMNYGYAGTRELNEALVSRFVVLDMPVISEENLQKLLRRTFPALSPQWAEQFAALFRDLRQKCDGGEITTKALDLRGLLSALHLVEKGISTGDALRLGIINKAFDPFERQLVADAVWSRIPQDAARAQLFTA